jgi:hypothetical protein
MKIRTQKTTHIVTIHRGTDQATFEVNPIDPAENSKLLRKYTTHKRVKGQMVEDVDFVAYRLHKNCRMGFER